MIDSHIIYVNLNELSGYNADFDSRMDTYLYFYVGVGCASLVANFISSFCFNIAAENQIKRIRTRLYESIVKQDMTFFERINLNEENDSYEKYFFFASIIISYFSSSFQLL